MSGDAKREDVVVPSESLIARYELLGRLGRGGMAEVWLARATGLHDFERILVLKRVLRDKRDDPRFVGMLRDEARVAATLDHPNVVHTLDVGLEGDELFITMEYLHGQDVKSMLTTARKAGEQLPFELAVQIAMGCAAGLHHAHEQTDSSGRPLNIVHRDVSPSNVIVTHHSGVKLIDFGIATAKSRKEHTAVGILKGKAAYMSPEQCRGKALDRRSDVFALGIMMYEMTTMVRPFEGESNLAVMHQICSEEPVPPSKIRDGYPPALERVVLRALQKEPGQRHQSAFEVLEELERVTRDCTLHALPGSLARYLEHLFGPSPHPWHTARPTAGAVSVGNLAVKANTSTVTQPKLQEAERPEPHSSAAFEPSRGTEGLGETTGASLEARSVRPTDTAKGLTTEPALPRLLGQDVLVPAAGTRRHSSTLIVAASVVVASLLVGWAASHSAGDPSDAPREAAVVSKAVAMAPTPALDQGRPTVTLSSVAANTPPDAAPSSVLPMLPPPATEQAVAEERAAFVLEGPSQVTIPKGASPISASKRAADAERLLDEARTLSLTNKAKALALTRKSLALKRSQEGFSLLGVLACNVGNAAGARKAYRNLSGKRRTDLGSACRAAGIELP